MVQWLVRFIVRSRKLSNVDRSLGGGNRELLRASEGTLSHWSPLYLQSLVSKNLHWTCVVGYGPFSLCVIRYVPEQWKH
jgi:hypothetical protein